MQDGPPVPVHGEDGPIIPELIKLLSELGSLPWHSLPPCPPEPSC